MKTYLGIELGSTRIKAVSIDSQHRPIGSGSYQWSSRYENNIWTYDLDQAWTGLKSALSEIPHRDDIAMMGISGMMHGYLAFDKNWQLLTPFRTWQNTMTAEAAEKLTTLFGFNIPQRWSIAHLYQAILNQEAHVNQVAHITTLAGYIHYKLTGVNTVGIGEASGIFPIDSQTLTYDAAMLDKFDQISGLSVSARELLPQVRVAGQTAGTLTQEGAALLDGLLSPGIPFAPPEGDAGTGMTATNAIAPRTGNVSAGTSMFSMIVLEKPLRRVYPEISPVTTPTGAPVAMVHCTNGTNDSNAWFSLLNETAQLFGAQPGEDLYPKLYEKALEGDPDCGQVLVCNYLSGESVTHLNAGRPMVVRRPDSRFTLANFLRATLYSTMATLKLGMEILKNEGVAIDSLTGHGGLFKTPLVGQKFLAAACNAPVTCMQTAGEGGPYGMALLTAYAAQKDKNETLEEYLNRRVFVDTPGSTVSPDPADVAGFAAYVQQFHRLLEVEKEAIDKI